MNNKITILVCCHKQDYYAQKYPFLPIQVGRAISSVDLGIQGDDTGDNISWKNRNYCELTALYWAWKNLKEVDIIGLCHYRRYFLLKNNIFNIGVQKYVCGKPDIVCDEKRIISDLEKYDIILPNKTHVKNTVGEYYAINHSRQDFDVLEEVIKEFYSEYEDSFHYLMYSSNSYSPCNMMICRKELFDDYCEWLFGVLKKVEERVHIQYYTPYQARIFGFMSERLLNVYCIHHHLRVKHYKILSFVSGKNRPVILELLGHFRSFLSFELTKKIW